MKNKFKEKLKELRLEKGLSQKALAQALGYSRSNIQDWESKGMEPAFDIVICIAQFFGVSVDYLLGLEDY